MAFRVGQKVVCVDGGPDIEGRPAQLVVGATYTVLRPVLDGLGILLHEAEPNEGHFGFCATRFRPVVERKTDISIFTAMLDKTPEHVG